MSQSTLKSKSTTPRPSNDTAREVRALVASWPPLTEQQCDELARLLGPYGGDVK
jgi:hypothetical protein